MYKLTEEDLQKLWNQSWLLSKGFDKKEETLESDYREKCFQDYLNSLKAKDGEKSNA